MAVAETKDVWVYNRIATKISDSKLRKLVKDAALDYLRGSHRKASIKSIDIIGVNYQVEGEVGDQLYHDDLKHVDLSVVADIKGSDDLYCEASLSKKGEKWEVKIEGCEI